MLFSHDLIDLKGQGRTSVRQMAVLAKTTGPLSDLLLYSVRDRRSASQGSVLQPLIEPSHAAGPRDVPREDSFGALAIQRRSACLDDSSPPGHASGPCQLGRT